MEETSKGCGEAGALGEFKGEETIASRNACHAKLVLFQAKLGPWGAPH